MHGQSAPTAISISTLGIVSVPNKNNKNFQLLILSSFQIIWMPLFFFSILKLKINKWRFFPNKSMKQHFRYDSLIESRFLRKEIKLKSFFDRAFEKCPPPNFVTKCLLSSFIFRNFFNFFEVVEHYEKKKLCV